MKGRRKSKRGGFLPALIPLIPSILSGLGALGAVAGGASAIANAVTNAKSKNRELAEMMRHNKVMEGSKKGSGVLLKAAKMLRTSRRGRKRATRGRGKKLMSRVPRRALTHEEVTRFAKKVLEIPHFRGVFTRDALPKTSRKRECGVVNLDDARGAGTHFVAYAKRGRTVRYFDSFGLPPLPSSCATRAGPT